MYESLELFVALLLGYYLFNFSKKGGITRCINLLLDFIVIAIIFLLGYNFSVFTSTHAVVVNVLSTSLGYTVIIFISNILGLAVYCRYNSYIKRTLITLPDRKKKDHTLITVIKACKYLIYLIIGYILGEVINIDITNTIDNLVFIFLLCLMFIIGLLLKVENISLKDLFKNKVALSIVLVVISMSLTSAVLISVFTNIPIKESIMISSGLGWYSLSVVLNSGFIGEYYGMVTFIVDFLREIIVIAMIPLLKELLSIELVGYAANTAMDFCLPVIKDNYGIKVVPLAISVGLIFTLITPILLILENLIL